MQEPCVNIPAITDSQRQGCVRHREMRINPRIVVLLRNHNALHLEDVPVLEKVVA